MSEKFLFDLEYERPLQITRTRVPLLLTCPQVKDEAFDLDDQSHVLRLDSNLHPIRLILSRGGDRGFGKHAMNANIHTLEISERFLQCYRDLKLLDVHIYLDYVETIGRGWLREIFPNVKRVEVYGYGDHSSEVLQLSHFLRRDFMSATDADLEIVLASPLAYGPVEEVP